MNAKEHELVMKQEVFDVVGCAIEILNMLGHGLLERPYENTLVVEFGLILNFRYAKLERKRVVLERNDS